MRSVIVLGAGMVGVATALQLQRRGWSVVLVDRNQPGRETSYGNAGFIHNEAYRPYPMPRDLPKLAAIATGRANDVHYSVASLPRHVGSLLRYWWHSAPERHQFVDIESNRIRDAHNHLEIRFRSCEVPGFFQDLNIPTGVRERPGFFVCIRCRQYDVRQGSGFSQEHVLHHHESVFQRTGTNLQPTNGIRSYHVKRL
jgi:D-amino-acid dehydrogenase